MQRTLKAQVATVEVGDDPLMNIRMYVCGSWQIGHMRSGSDAPGRRCENVLLVAPIGSCVRVRSECRSSLRLWCSTYLHAGMEMTVSVVSYTGIIGAGFGCVGVGSRLCEGKCGRYV